MVKDSIKCIMCDKSVAILDQEKHIHKHLGYLPERCGSCDKRFHSRDLLNQHCLEANHDPGQSCHDLYMDHLVNYISRDTLQADRHGIGAVLAKKRVAAVSIASESRKRKSYSENEIQPELSSRKRVYPQSADKSDDEGDDEVEEMVVIQPKKQSPPKRTPAKSAPITNKPTATPKKSRSVTHSASEQTTPVVARAVEVPPIISIVSPKEQAEIREKVENMKQLETNPREFCLQCRKHVTSETGRRSHAMLCHYKKKLQCPLCDYACLDHSMGSTTMEKHLNVDHKLSHGRETLPEPVRTAYNTERHKILSGIDSWKARLFPMPTVFPDPPAQAAPLIEPRSKSPARISPASTKKRNSSSKRKPDFNEEEEEEEEEDDEDEKERKKKDEEKEKAAKTNRKQITVSFLSDEESSRDSEDEDIKRRKREETQKKINEEVKNEDRKGENSSIATTTGIAESTVAHLGSPVREEDVKDEVETPQLPQHFLHYRAMGVPEKPASEKHFPTQAESDEVARREQEKRIQRQQAARRTGTGGKAHIMFGRGGGGGGRGRGGGGHA